MAPFVTHHLSAGAAAHVDPGLRLPSGTERNVAALKAELTDRPGLGFDARRCQTVTPSDPESLLAQVEEGSDPDAGPVVYWAGNATLADDGTLSLALPGSRAHDLRTWLPARQLAERMMAPSGRVRDRLLILDICPHAFTGTLAGRYDELIRRAIERVTRSGIAVLSSMGTLLTGFAANGYGLLVFTQQLTELLRSRGRSAELRLDRLHRELRRPLARRQTPRTPATPIHGQQSV